MENTSDSLTLRLFYFAWKSENEFVIKWLIIEMEQYLREIGFLKIQTYASFSKEPAMSDKDELFLLECMVS